MTRFFFLLFVGFAFLLLSGPRAHAQMLNDSQSKVLATCMVRSADGAAWVGTDGQGVFSRTADGSWKPFAGARELGDSHIVCLAVDGGKRLWCGMASGGLCVWARGAWTRFSSLDGPLASRVNALKAADDGSVWGATDAGLFHWSDGDGWEFPGLDSTDETTRDLARRPIYALAIDSQSQILCATDAGLVRLAVGTKNEAKAQLIGHAASPVQPSRAMGSGFLPGPVHDVALDSLGGLWCATRWGVCQSGDAGQSWHFLRGRDWEQNARGSAVPLSLNEAKPTVDLLAEDWVTTLAPTPDGKMWLGFRSGGAQERDAHTLETLVSSSDEPKSIPAPVWGGSWVSAIVPFAPDQAMFARYGGGLFSFSERDFPAPTGDGGPSVAPAPDPATTSPELLASLGKSLDKRVPLAPGGAAFYALDRETRGDWPLRYGNAGAQILGGKDSMGDVSAFAINADTGPHRAGVSHDFSVATLALSSNDINVLQAPLGNRRTHTEVSDGSISPADYPLSFDGADLWVSFSVPEGTYRVAPYWFSFDATNGLNRLRDHRLQLFSGDLSPKACLDHEPLAQTRLWNGSDGEYAAFIVRGPAKYQMRVARDRSHGTTLQGLFFDKLGAPVARPNWLPAHYVLPIASAPASASPYAGAIALWSACDRAEARGVPAHVERLVALRAATQNNAPVDLLRAWRVQAGAWDENSSDRRDVALGAKGG